MNLLQSAVGSKVLLFSANQKVCAVPVSHVVEVMRPLPVEPLAGAPDGVVGLAVIRGRPTPVVDLDLILGHGSNARPDSARFITLRSADRIVALQVAAVRAIGTLDRDRLDSLPPLWRGPRPPAIAALGALDRELLVVLETARLLPDDWRAEDREGGGA